MNVGVASDRGEFSLKTIILEFLKESGYEVIDFGATVRDLTDDYPDFVIPLAQAIASNHVDRGIAICGGGPLLSSSNYCSTF